MLKYRHKYDSLFDLTKSQSISEAISTAGISEFNKETICIYVTIDDLIKKCNFNEKQLEILNYYQDGYTEKDIAEIILKDKEKQSEIHKIINTCVKKISQQSKYDWLYNFIYWNKKKTNENWKICNICTEWKPESDFYKEEKGKDGLRPQCKKCK